jgi:hypothetical protein
VKALRLLVAVHLGATLALAGLSLEACSTEMHAHVVGGPGPGDVVADMDGGTCAVDMSAWPLPDTDANWEAAQCWSLDEPEPVYPDGLDAGGVPDGSSGCADGAAHWRCTDTILGLGMDAVEVCGPDDPVCVHVDCSAAPWVCCTRDDAAP